VPIAGENVGRESRTGPPNVTRNDGTHEAYGLFENREARVGTLKENDGEQYVAYYYYYVTGRGIIISNATFRTPTTVCSLDDVLYEISSFFSVSRITRPTAVVYDTNTIPWSTTASGASVVYIVVYAVV